MFARYTRARTVLLTWVSLPTSARVRLNRVRKKPNFDDTNGPSKPFAGAQLDPRRVRIQRLPLPTCARSHAPVRRSSPTARLVRLRLHRS